MSADTPWILPHAHSFAWTQNIFTPPNGYTVINNTKWKLGGGLSELSHHESKSPHQWSVLPSADDEEEKKWGVVARLVRLTGVVSGELFPTWEGVWTDFGRLAADHMLKPGWMPSSTRRWNGGWWSGREAGSWTDDWGGCEWVIIRFFKWPTL